VTCQFGRCRPDGRLARNRMQGKNVYLLFIPVKNRHESQKNKYPRRGLCAALAARRRTAGRELGRKRERARELDETRRVWERWRRSHKKPNKSRSSWPRYRPPRSPAALSVRDLIYIFIIPPERYIYAGGKTRRIYPYYIITIYIYYYNTIVLGL